MAGVTQLGYLGLGVSDMAVWKEFATDVLGLQPNGESERNSLFLRIDRYHHRFEIYPTGEDDILYAGWEVKDANALAEIAEQVRAAGIQVSEGSLEDADERMVLGLIRFKDPDGLQTEVYYGPQLDHSKFNSPRGIEGFKTGENGTLGLGHIVVHVDDVDKTLGFYVNTLGVKISDYVEMNFGGNRPRLAFGHVNGRHHSIALVPKSMLRGMQMPRLHHFMIEVNSLDEVGMTLGIFQQRGMPAGNIGRHTNDWMVSFYAPTPSGFQVEYGWGARLVDDTNWEITKYTAGSFWGHGRAGAPQQGQVQGQPQAAAAR